MNLEIETIGRFQLYGEWAPELLPSMRELLRKYECLLPAWCQIAYVSFDGSDAPEYAWCSVKMADRQISIGVRELFFRIEATQQSEIIIHELMHANTAMVKNCAFECLSEALKDNSIALKISEKRIKEANEGITCDLTALVVALLK